MVRVQTWTLLRAGQRACRTSQPRPREAWKAQPAAGVCSGSQLKRPQSTCQTGAAMRRAPSQPLPGPSPLNSRRGSPMPPLHIKAPPPPTPGPFACSCVAASEPCLQHLPRQCDRVTNASQQQRQQQQQPLQQQQQPEMMPSPPARFPTADGEAPDPKLNRSNQNSPQPYHRDPAALEPSSSTAWPPAVHLPSASQDRSESLLDLFQPPHTQPTTPLPSPPPSAAIPTPPLPARSDSLSHRRRVLPENDAKASPPTTQPLPAAGFPSPQSAHPTISSRSISVSDWSSNGDTFSSRESTSYLSSKSSKSSFAWDLPMRAQSISGKRNVQELAPVEERNLLPSTYQDPVAQHVRAPEMSTPTAIDLSSQGYGDDSFEEEASPADQIIFEIMSHIKTIPDLIAAAQVNTGFYGVFCDRGVDLIKSIILATSPAAWEYMETAYSTPDHPSSFLQNYRQSLSCLSAVKNTLFLRGESTLKPDTMDGLMGASHEKGQKVDAALWRIWTFCEIFGGESGRDRDSQAQMAWLQQGAEARIPDTLASFGHGNRKGLSVSELLLMAELWNVLSTLLQEAFRLPSEDYRYTLFAHTDAQYPEELYLLEWVSYVMTFGLGPISVLACGSFEEAENLGFANWSPPREFGTRQAFLKNAVASTYRRRLEEEAEAKAAAAGLSMRATHRALATTKRRPIVRPAPPSENVRNPTGVVPRKRVGSGAPTKTNQPLPPRTPQMQPPPIPQYNTARPRQAAVPQRPPSHDGGLQLRQGLDYLRPEDVHAGMVSFLDPETRPGSTVNNYFSPSAARATPSLSGDSSEHSYHIHTPSSPPLPLHQLDRQQLHPSSHKYAVVDPVDRALALLVDEMGFSLAASKKALAASDDGSGLNTDKAIALLREGVAASSSEKIPVIDTKDSTKSTPRFGGMKFRFSSKPTQPAGSPFSPPPLVKPPPQPAAPQRTFGELRPTKKERAAYAGLSSDEAKGIKTDVFRAQVYKEAFGDLFHGGREEKSRKGSNSTLSAAEVGGRPLSPMESWSIRSLDVESISSKKMEAAAAADVKSVKS
jgi:hypothetical protein